MSSHPKFVVVATVSGMMQAELVRSQLESAGIPVMLDYESAAHLFGLTVSGLKLSEVRILVSEADEMLARQVLDTPPPPGWEVDAESAADSPADPASETD